VWNGYGVCSNLASSGDPPPPASQDTLTTGFSVQKYPTMLCASMFSKHDDDWDDGDDDNNAYSQESNDDNY